MTVRLGVLSDVHHTIPPARELAYHNSFDVEGVLDRVREALAWFAREQVTAVILDGDLADAGDLPSLAAVVETVVDVWPGPTLAVSGNHDVAERPDAVAHAAREAGRGRVETASPEGVLLGGVRVVGLDPWPEAGPPALPRAPGDCLAVIVSHYPVFSRADVFERSGMKYAGDLPDRERFVAGLLGRGPALVVNGHLHGRDTHADGDVLQLSVAALVEPPFEATVLEIETDREHPTVRRRAARLRDVPVAREPVFAPADETRRFDASCWVPL